MKRIHTATLLDDLAADVRPLILRANTLKKFDQQTLQTQPAPGAWSIAQILEHLNFYSEFYIRNIEEKLHKNEFGKSEYYTPGWFGNYFTKLMRPTDDFSVKNKMKTMKSAVPPKETDGFAALEKFISDQHHLLNLLEIAKSAHIGKIKIPITISKLIKLKLGDTFRFFIAHEQRHFIQIKNTLASIQKLNNTVNANAEYGEYTEP